MKEEEKTIRNFIIILIIVILACATLYFTTKYLVNKDNTSKNDAETKETTINYNVAIVGNMLSKTDAEYYVMIYDNTSSNVSDYQLMISSYGAKDNSLPVYTVDLSNSLNSKYYTDGETNTNADNIQDLKFGQITLLKVKNGKITNSYESVDSIKKVWNIN